MKGQHFLPRQLTSDSHRPSAEVLTANSEIVNKRAKLKHYLVLSAKVTILMMCDKFTTLTEKKQILSQQRCFVCLKVGHVLKDCPSSQKEVCCHCGRKEYYIRCLCPQSFQDRKQMPYWSWNQVNHLLRIMLIPLLLLMRVWVYDYS